MDLVIEARAFVRGTLSEVHIGVDEETGKIVAVKKTLPGATRRKFSSGRVLLPSGVDWHVHFRDPGHPKKEDFETGTRAAAFGGVGTVFDMPNTAPLVDRASRLEDKIERVRTRAFVDWGLWATVTAQTPNVPKLLKSAVGLKLYLAPTTGIDEGPDDALVRSAFTAAQAENRWVAVHAESFPRQERPTSLRAHHESRSSESEVQAIERVARLGGGAGQVHIAHATTVAALEAADRAGFSAGATPQHLLLSHEGRSGPSFKVNPPLRTETERRGLFEALGAGSVPHLETDHAPHTVEDKSAPFPDAPAGMPGVETMLPLLLHASKHGDVKIGEIIAATAERPAAAMGLLKGRIEPGHDADFFVADLRDTYPLRGDALHSRCGWTPFEGWDAIRITDHYVRGRSVVEEGQFTGRKGGGRRVEPAVPATRVARA